MAVREDEPMKLHDSWRRRRIGNAFLVGQKNCENAKGDSEVHLHDVI